MNTVSIQTHFPQSLSPIVKSFWYLEVSNFCDSFYEEEIIPDGHHEIIFHLNSHPAKRKPENNNWIIEPNAFLAGQTLKSYALQMPPGAKLFGIRFYPHTLFNLLRFPVKDLTDRILPLSDVADAESFWNCITGDPHKTFSNFEKLLSEKMQTLDFQTNNDIRVNAAVSEILRHGGNVAVEHLLKKTGVSGKYLDELFKRYVGLTPKTLCGIIKLNNFIAYKNDNPEKNLTECCYEMYYYDQSHLIKSFYKFTNQSLKVFFRDDNRINEIFMNL